MQIQFKVYLIILLITTIGDLLIPVIIGFKYPGYNHLQDTISSLGTKISPVQKYQCLNLMIVGFLLIVFTIGQYQAFESIRWSHILYLTGLILFGTGTVLAGFFPEDPIGMSETVSGKIHGISSGIGFLFLIFNPLWAIWIKEFKGLTQINVAAFLLASLTFVLFIVSEKKNSGIFKYTGLLQRLNLFILYGNMIFNYINTTKIL
jgi:hypothetical protein